MSGKNLSKGDRLVSEVNEKSGELFDRGTEKSSPGLESYPI